MTREAALAAATVTLLAAATVPRLLVRRPPWVRALWRLSVLIVLTFLVERTVGSPVAPQFQGGTWTGQLWEQTIAASWWIIAAQGAIGLARLLIVLEARPRETQIISDLLAGAIYVVTILAIINFVFEVPIRGLLATSGVIAIVLGLALQSTLADVFSGIAVGIERPYKAGDLIWVEGGIEGRVIQVNWRSTHIATSHKDVAVVPNSVIAKARLVNHSLPTPSRGVQIEIRVDAGAPPARCLAVLTAAVRACMLPVDVPPASVDRTELLGDGAVYAISFSVPTSDLVGPARTEMFGHIQRHLRHAGISLAVAGAASVPQLPVPTTADLLELSDWFGDLAPIDRNLLADHLAEVLLECGEFLIRQDDPPEALFIIASGAVEISSRTPTGKRIIHRMGPGGSLGAIAMITNSPYATTATAITPVKAYRLDKEGITAAMALRPELADSLEALARRSQAMLTTDVASHETDRLQPPEMFLTRLRSFLRKLAVDPTGPPV